MAMETEFMVRQLTEHTGTEHMAEYMETGLAEFMAADITEYITMKME